MNSTTKKKEEEEEEEERIQSNPMSRESEPLSNPDLLITIFETLTLADLARAACVSRLWYSLASHRDILTRAFMSPWKLTSLVGSPVSNSFWRDNTLRRFALSHPLQRTDSVASLAVKYSVQVMDIKRLNNMMSDHGIYSRQRLLIPINRPDILIGGTCYIELDSHAKREVVVLYQDGAPDKISDYVSDRVSSARGRRRIVDSLKRSMQVDDGTAQYYLDISNGDPRAALTEFSDDLSWEWRTGLA